MKLCLVKSLQLNGARRIDSRANHVGTFTGIFAGELLVTQPWDFNLDIDAIEQRPGDF